MEDRSQISLIYPACFEYILFLKNVKMIPNPFLLPNPFVSTKFIAVTWI